MTMIKKNVSFGEISVEELKKETVEKNALWYNKDELKGMRIDMEIQAMQGDCKRGIESLDNSNHSQTKRKQLFETVLALQEEHRDNKLQDDKGLAQMASALTRDCQKGARRRASMDSIAAFRAHSEHLGHLLQERTEKEFAKPTKIRTRRIPRRASTVGAKTSSSAISPFKQKGMRRIQSFNGCDKHFHANKNETPHSS